MQHIKFSIDIVKLVNRKNLRKIPQRMTLIVCVICQRVTFYKYIKETHQHM